MKKFRPNDWHLLRRKLILDEHPEVKELCGHDPLMIGQILLLPLMNIGCAYWASSLSWIGVIILSATLGAMIRMRIFNVMHELSHHLVHPFFTGRARTLAIAGVQLPAAHDGFFSYYRWFHLSHHSELGAQSVNKAKSIAKGFGQADGDLLGTYPLFTIKLNEDDRVLVSSGHRTSAIRKFFRFGVFLPLINFLQSGAMAIIFLPRDILLLAKIKDANFRSLITGRVVWIATMVLTFAFFGSKGLGYLFFSLAFYRGFLFHPCLAFWITVHKSHHTNGGCQPTSSVYGPVMDFFCGGVNYHTEHHDFPAIPVRKLRKLSRLAPQFYQSIPRYSGCLQTYGEFLGRSNQTWIYGCQDLTVAEDEENRAVPA